MTPARPITACSEERGGGGQLREYGGGPCGHSQGIVPDVRGSFAEQLQAKGVPVKARRGARPWPLNSLSQPLGQSPLFLGHSHSRSTTLFILGGLLDPLPSHSPALYPTHSLEQARPTAGTESRSTGFRLGRSGGPYDTYPTLLLRQDTDRQPSRNEGLECFPHHPAIPQFSVDTDETPCKMHSILMLSTRREHRTPQVRGSVPQIPPPTSDASHQSKWSPVLLTDRL